MTQPTYPMDSQHKTGPRAVRGGWVTQRSAGDYALARHWPPRFDVSAQAMFPRVRPDRLAHQIRQDMWRLLQGLRGFSPAVRIEDMGQGLRVTAGGRLIAQAPSGTAARLDALLNDPGHRQRWLAWARGRAT